MGLALLGGVIAGILSLSQGADLTWALGAGVYTGAATFLAWVITREIDPDHPFAAHISGVIALVASIALESPPLAWIFLRERIRPGQWLGIALILAGILLVSL
jgi:uncharacterized membrane protein